jgi:hypothetical protein
MDRKNNIHENGDDSKLKAYAGNKLPYDIPETYFEELPGKVLDRIHNVPARQVSMRARMMQLAAAAAVLVIVALASLHFLFNTETELTPDEAFSIEDIYYYNLDNMAELEDAYLMSYIAEDSISLPKLLEDEVDEISDEDIMEYLLAENHIEYYIINEY